MCLKPRRGSKVYSGVDMDRNVGSGFPRGLGKGRVYPDGHRVGRRRPIQGMQDANPVCAFSSGGLGLRCSVFGPRRRTGTGSRVPGGRYPTPVPGTWYQVKCSAMLRKPAHGVCRMVGMERPLGVGAQSGTEFAGGCRTFRRSRRRVRASGLLRRRVAVRREPGRGWAGGVYLPVVV
jgi:hypothetical protein